MERFHGGRDRTSFEVRSRFEFDGDACSESWRIEEQWSNYTSWRYTARFACGARCAGVARVAAHDSYEREGATAGVPRHGATAVAHHVLLELGTCRTLPLLPWPSFCGTCNGYDQIKNTGRRRNLLAPRVSLSRETCVRGASDIKKYRQSRNERSPMGFRFFKNHVRNSRSVRKFINRVANIHTFLGTEPAAEPSP